MPIFQYTATSPDGQLVTNEMEAVTVAEAVEQLLAQQLRVQSIREVLEADPLVDESVDPSVESDVESTPDRRQIETILSDRIARILENRSSVVPALEAYAAELSSRHERKNILDLAQQIRQGDATALSSNPQSARLACAAAVSASPSRLIRSLMSDDETDASGGRTVRQILVYPALVFFASLALFGGFANLIAPGFNDIFESFDTELPSLTVLVLRTADLVRSLGWSWFVMVGALAPIMVWYFLIRRSTDQIRGSQVPTFTESLADLIEAEVASPTAVRLAGRATTDAELNKSAEHLATCMQQDRDANSEPYFGLPRSLVHAVADTERPSATASLLRELAVIYRKTDRRSQNLLIAILEPFAIIFVGLFAGFVLLSLLLPLTSLISNLT